MNETRAEFPDVLKPSYSRRRLILFILLAFAIHLALIFIFGAKKIAAARAVENIPQLRLADNSSEMVALQNPTLFALPNPKDFAFAVRQKIPVAPANDFRWTEPPRWLAAPENAGAVFRQFIQTNIFASVETNPRLSPHVVAPVATPDDLLPKNSTLEIAGALAQRKLSRAPDLSALAANDILKPSRVQALVDAAGNVVSVVLLASSGKPDADQRALTLARTAKFSRAQTLTLGEIIFHWQTVPATNAPETP